MFCPRCGTENDDDNRFCVSCGATLAGETAREKTDASAGAAGGADQPSPAPNRLQEVVGTTRRARIVTALTVLAVAVAVVAFIVLRSGDTEGEVPQDAYLRGQDRVCVAEKTRLSSLESETLTTAEPDINLFSSLLVRVVTEWQANLHASSPPPVHVPGVRQAEAALLGVLIEAGKLNRLAREGATPAQIATQTEAVDAATKHVDPAFEALGLERCPTVPVTPQ
jgi:hypothetical protein